MVEIGKAICERLMKTEAPLPLSTLQKEMGTHFNTLKHHLKYIQIIQDMPKISVSKVGKQILVKTEKTDEDLQFLREIIEDEIPDHVYLLVELYNARATTIEKAVPLSLFPKDYNTIDIQASQQRVVITTDNRVYLTLLGLGIAEGTKRYISVTSLKRKIPQSISMHASYDIDIPVSLQTHSMIKSSQLARLYGDRGKKSKVRFEKGKLIIEIPYEDTVSTKEEW